MVVVANKIECTMGSPLEREICKGRTGRNLDKNANSSVGLPNLEYGLAERNLVQQNCFWEI
jgi:hypothetical protein